MVRHVSLEGSSGPTDVLASVADYGGNVGTAAETAIVDGNVIRVSADSHGHQATSANTATSRLL